MTGVHRDMSKPATAVGTWVKRVNDSDADVRTKDLAANGLASDELLRLRNHPAGIAIFARSPCGNA